VAVDLHLAVRDQALEHGAGQTEIPRGQHAIQPLAGFLVGDSKLDGLERLAWMGHGNGRRVEW